MSRRGKRRSRVDMNTQILEEYASRGAKPILKRRADAIKTAAEAIAPRETGEYASNFEIREGSGVVWVVNTSEYANIIEFGARGGRNPKFRPLGRALNAGLRG